MLIAHGTYQQSISHLSSLIDCNLSNLSPNQVEHRSDGITVKIVTSSHTVISRHWHASSRTKSCGLSLLRHRKEDIATFRPEAKPFRRRSVETSRCSRKQTCRIFCAVAEEILGIAFLICPHGRKILQG